MINQTTAALGVVMLFHRYIVCSHEEMISGYKLVGFSFFLYFLYLVL